MVLDGGRVVPRQSESAFKSSVPHTSLLKSANALCRSACKGRLGSLTGLKGVAGGLFCNQRGTCIRLAKFNGCRVVAKSTDMRP
jgi:hypothetical protein